MRERTTLKIVYYSRMSVDLRAVLTVAEVAEVLGITPGHVRLLIHRDQLPAGRFGRDRTVTVTDLEAYIARTRPTPSPSE